MISLLISCSNFLFSDNVFYNPFLSQVNVLSLEVTSFPCRFFFPTEVLCISASLRRRSFFISFSSFFLLLRFLPSSFLNFFLELRTLVFLPFFLPLARVNDPFKFFSIFCRFSFFTFARVLSMLVIRHCLVLKGSLRNNFRSSFTVFQPLLYPLSACPLRVGARAFRLDFLSFSV